MHQNAHHRQRAARWPTGHLAWAYSGRGDFEGRAASFLAEGHARGERQILIVDDPRAALWPRRLIDRGDLLLLSTSEAYGSARVVRPAPLRAAFEGLLVDALRLGYTGLRVAGDNTSLTASPERLAAWLDWEDRAEHLMRAKPITGLCAFDSTRTDPAALEMLLHLHHVVVRNEPASGF